MARPYYEEPGEEASSSGSCLVIRDAAAARPVRDVRSRATAAGGCAVVTSPAGRWRRSARPCPSPSDSRCPTTEPAHAAPRGCAPHRYAGPPTSSRNSAPHPAHPVPRSAASDHGQGVGRRAKAPSSGARNGCPPSLTDADKGQPAPPRENECQCWKPPPTGPPQLAKTPQHPPTAASWHHPSVAATARS